MKRLSGDELAQQQKSARRQLVGTVAIFVGIIISMRLGKPMVVLNDSVHILFFSAPYLLRIMSSS